MSTPEEPMDPQEAEELRLRELQTISRIATELRARSVSVKPLDRTFLDEKEEDPRLDPSNREFDHYHWAETVLSYLSRSNISLTRQGVVFTNLNVSGSGASIQYQETVLSILTAQLRGAARRIFGGKSATRRRILRDFNGVLQSGELLLVLGRPGSGCTTFLKSICGHFGGLTLEPESDIRYEGFEFKQMTKQYRGEVAYNQEVDEHFPHLTAGETLSFAAAARVPRRRPDGLSRAEFVDTIVKVVMAVFGLSHVYDTKVGDNFVRGVSGGERKRISIAEMFLSRARIAAWDNSTRGLDAASALQFIKSLRLSADLGKSCHAVAAYQSSQPMYDQFDKVILLYEGREIYYGSCSRAGEYFHEMGWHREAQQVIPDFLTAITNPGERQPREGMETKVPRTPDEFADYWKRSPEYKQLMEEMEKYKEEHPLGGDAAQEFQANHREQQANHTRPASPYLLSVPMQIRLCLRRGFQRMRNDWPTVTSTVTVQIILAIILGSVYLNSPNNTDAFFQKGAVLFFAVLLNALITINEIMQLYAQRPIAEKQARYAFVHPFAEALASLIVDLPVKFVRCTIFSIVLYFMVGLRREAAQFFIFYLFIVIAILTMSGIFRTLAAATRTMGSAMGLAGILIICIIVYTGFMLPPTYMHPWFSWIRWINPVYYAFEALMANEFHAQQFECAMVIPPYGSGSSFVCPVVGALPGERFVSGDRYIAMSFEYYYSHVWRNFGIIIAMMIFFHITYLVATEYNQIGQSKAEALVFRPRHAPKYLLDGDEESSAKPVKPPSTSASEDGIKFTQQKDLLMWKGVNYDIPVKEGTRRLLNDVNGWVKPGTLTALMGVSGAGKTTLLDVLAQRVKIGVVSGDIFVNGLAPASTFPRKTGYVQQQDLHLETTTVREALRFSAVLRQPRKTPKKEKYDYVEEVIQLLGMEDFAEAVVGELGEGLNVEQRKLLSIGVELAAKPTILFLDEPTSGLDSQSSWTICAFLRKLADHGQPVLATIHQPSAVLFQNFDRLLFLAKGGRTVYFGEIGRRSSTLLDYFSRNGARPLNELENPAEYILAMVNGEGSDAFDWPETWNNSPECAATLAELEELLAQPPPTTGQTDPSDNGEFALPFYSQFWYVSVRAFQQYYRKPEYIYAKLILAVVSSLFIGFSFWKVDSTMQGFQNGLFSIFLMCTIFSTLVNQVMPEFVIQRSLYEVRERPSRVYSWRVFVLSQILVEVPWQLLMGICAWASFFFAVFGTHGTPESKGLSLLFIVQFYIYSASMAQMVVAAIPDPAMASMIAIFMFGLAFLFNGVMQPPDDLGKFWIFMWRVSPFTYYVGGISAAVLHGRRVVCSREEMSIFSPPDGLNCGTYLEPFLKLAPGELYNPDSTTDCEYCQLAVADQYLATREIFWSQRWRNYGLFIVYFFFNIFAMVALYYLFRVKVWKKRKA